MWAAAINLQPAAHYTSALVATRAVLCCAAPRGVLCAQNKRYDEVMDEYRTNLYTLRRLLLLGSTQQRMQVILLLIQVRRERDGMGWDEAHWQRCGGCSHQALRLAGSSSVHRHTHGSWLTWFIATYTWSVLPLVGCNRPIGRLAGWLVGHRIDESPICPAWRGLLLLLRMRVHVSCGARRARAPLSAPALCLPLVQRYVDAVVGEFLDPAKPPAAWLEPSLSAEGLPFWQGSPADKISPLQVRCEVQGGTDPPCGWLCHDQDHNDPCASGSGSQPGGDVDVWMSRPL